MQHYNEILSIDLTCFNISLFTLSDCSLCPVFVPHAIVSWIFFSSGLKFSLFKFGVCFTIFAAKHILTMFWEQNSEGLWSDHFILLLLPSLDFFLLFRYCYTGFQIMRLIQKILDFIPFLSQHICTLKSVTPPQSWTTCEHSFHVFKQSFTFISSLY